MSTADPPERLPALYLSDFIARRFTRPDTVWTSTPTLYPRPFGELYTVSVFFGACGEFYTRVRQTSALTGFSDGGQFDQHPALVAHRGK